MSYNHTEIQREFRFGGDVTNSRTKSWRNSTNRRQEAGTMETIPKVQ
jgi:hypothetical protein